MRHAFVIGLIAIFAASSVDLGACGDKFLRVGRSARFRRYAAVYPASVLIYTPGNATPAGIREFEALLKRAGHRPVVVDSGTSIPRALAAAPYDLVIADYADAGHIKDDLQSASSKADQGCGSRSRKAVRVPDQAARNDEVRCAGRNRSAHAVETEGRVRVRRQVETVIAETRT